MEERTQDQGQADLAWTPLLSWMNLREALGLPEPPISSLWMWLDTGYLALVQSLWNFPNPPIKNILLSDCDTRPLIMIVVQGCFLVDEWHLEKWHKVPESTKGRMTHRDTHEHARTHTLLSAHRQRAAGKVALGNSPLTTMSQTSGHPGSPGNKGQRRFWLRLMDPVPSGPLSSWLLNPFGNPGYTETRLF